LCFQKNRLRRKAFNRRSAILGEELKILLIPEIEKVATDSPAVAAGKNHRKLETAVDMVWNQWYLSIGYLWE